MFCFFLHVASFNSRINKKNFYFCNFSTINNNSSGYFQENLTTAESTETNEEDHFAGT